MFSYRMIFGLTIATFCALFVQHLPAEELNDGAINETVRKRIAYDNAVRLDEIESLVSDGIVTLVGSVDHLLAKQRATRVVETIRGVRSVINRLQVESVAKPDDELARDVRSALKSESAIEADGIETAVEAGRVTIEGRVKSHAEASLAYETAAGVLGVRALESKLEIQQVADRPDEEIGRDLRGRLESSVWIDGQSISSRVEEGKVWLTGRVATQRQREIASSLSFIAGVKSVDVDGLAIDPSLSIGVGQQHSPARNDVQIQQAIQDALRYDPRVDAKQVEVDVKNGLVQLTGMLDTLQGKHAAKHDAENTIGVWRVDDKLRVNPQSVPADTELQAKIEAALERDAYLADAEIVVSVDSGQVTLRGSVAAPIKMQRAEELIGRLKHVTAIDNQIVVDSDQLPWALDPMQIKYIIKNRLYWNPLIKEDNVSVDVDQRGVARLDGFVNREADLETARNIALDSGATAVRSSLRVRSN